MKLKGQILKAIDSPKELEILYRGNPEEFVKVFPEVYKKHPDSLVLQAWQVRLTFSDPVKGKAQAQQVVEETNPGRFRLLKSILIIFLLTIVAGTLIKLPHFFPKIDGDLFYSRNLAQIIILSLAVYFITQKLPPLKVLIVFVLLSAGTVVYMIFLPDLNYSDSITLSYIHMPFFFWSLLGLAFLGANWRNLASRLDYIRYNGELLIYSTILYIASAIFIAITFALFSLIDNPDFLFGEYLSEYALVYGMVALPLVATFLIDKILGNRINIASVLSKVFAPLFLIMVTVYLVVIVVNQENPFMDRDFLLTFNFLLILVLTLSIFSILERPAKETVVTSDYINLALVLVTLIIDGIALSAILFRLTSYGLTPNRIAVLGVNVLFFVHLLGILIYYVRFIIKRGTIGQLENWIARYLPVYSVWVLFVAVAIPLIFHYR